MPPRSDIQIFKHLGNKKTSKWQVPKYPGGVGTRFGQGLEQAAQRWWRLRPQPYPELSWTLERWRSGWRPLRAPPTYRSLWSPWPSQCCIVAIYPVHADVMLYVSNAIYLTMLLRKIGNYFCFCTVGESCALQSWWYCWRRRSAGGTGMKGCLHTVELAKPLLFPSVN